MKKFLIHIGCWFAALTITCVALNPLIDNGLRKMNNYSKSQMTIEELLSDTIHADIIIMGNSRALCSYDPIILDSILHTKSYNIGVSGQPFGISYLRYQLFRQHNESPRILIINIDNNDLEMYNSDFGREQYYPYFSNPFIRNYLSSLGFSWWDMHLPLYKYKGDYKLVGYSLLSLVGMHPLPYAQHIRGYYNGNTPFDISELRAELRKTDSFPTSVEPEAVELFAQFVQQQVHEGVQPVFVYAPQYELLRTHVQRDKCMQVYDSIAALYAIPILDYSAIEWSNDSAYFYNANHVNQRGAELFTISLVHDMDSLKL